MKWQQPLPDENDGGSVEMLSQLSLLGKFNLLTSASIYSGARVVHSGLTGRLATEGKSYSKQAFKQ
jgi:hypothetical protein